MSIAAPPNFAAIPKYPSAAPPRSRNLTPRQLDVLVTIRNYRHLNGYSPTIQEIGDQLGITKVSAHEHIQQLELKRFVTHLKHKARSLEIIGQSCLPDEGRSTLLPLLGSLKTGQPIDPQYERESIDLEQMFHARRGVYVLRVRDDYFAFEHLRAGDFLVVERREKPRNDERFIGMDCTGKVVFGRSPVDGGVIVQGIVIGVVRGMR